MIYHDHRIALNIDTIRAVWKSSNYSREKSGWDDTGLTIQTKAGHVVATYPSVANRDKAFESIVAAMKGTTT